MVRTSKVKTKNINTIFKNSTIRLLVALLFIGIIALNLSLQRFNHQAGAISLGETNGSHWYVSPAGTQTNTGNIDSPWNLQYALSGSGNKIKPGDEIWLRGGTYAGNYTSTVTGSESARITVKSYPSEWAVLQSNTLGSGRTLSVYGAWTDFTGFEVTNTNPNRSHDRYDGVYVYGPNIRIINLVIHDNGDGIGAWRQALNTEIYGNIIYNNGYGSGDWHGHGIYTQNKDGIKQIKDNIIFHQYEYGIHAYGTDAAYLENFVFEGNISFDNGVYYDNKRQSGIFIGGNAVADNVTIKDNLLYNRLDKYGQSLSVGMGTATTVNGSVSCQGNYIIGGSNHVLSFSRWQSGVVSRNTIYGPTQITNTIIPDGIPYSAISWNYNNYLGGYSVPFYLDQAYRFSDWIATTGFDTNSTYTPGRPTGIWKFVRPNQYDPKRAHIVVYNWDDANSITFSSSDLLTTGLKPGDSYVVRDVQNYFGDFLSSGTFDGNGITIPLPDTNATVAHPVGGSIITHTSKEFNTFVLDFSPSSPTPTPSPTSTASPTSTSTISPTSTPTSTATSSLSPTSNPSSTPGVSSTPKPSSSSSAKNTSNPSGTTAKPMSGTSSSSPTITSGTGSSTTNLESGSIAVTDPSTSLETSPDLSSITEEDTTIATPAATLDPLKTTPASRLPWWKRWIYTVKRWTGDNIVKPSQSVYFSTLNFVKGLW